MATPLAHQDAWSGENVRVADVERALCELREDAEHEDEGPDLRTSVMTHIAWVPAEWQEAALETLEGLAERHPSRAILLFPEPDAADGIDAKAMVLAYTVPGARRHIAAEVVELRLRGRRGRVPGSIVTPLLVAELPVFVRWRGRPPFGAQELDELVDLADRLVVDSGEWPDVPDSYAELAGLFDRVACSDIAWRRTLAVRRALAAQWPAIADQRKVKVSAPPAEVALLKGWLRSRLDQELEIVTTDDAELRVEEQASSDLLSAELDELVRDPIYEAAVRASA
jgi:glucose-6-phosphate dehydrogenase assembly protein OpcA